MSNGEVTTVGIPSLFGLTGTKQAFQDEGILLGEAQTVNFVGDGVTATLAAGVLTVQIDGGGSSINLITTIEEVTELDVTSAITPSVIYDLDLLKADLDSPVFTGTPTAPTPQTEPSLDNSTKLATTAFVNVVASTYGTIAQAKAEYLVLAASDESTALTTGTGKVTFRMPYAMTLTGVRCSLTAAQESGSIFTVDINEGGTTILSTKLTIDNTEKTSTTAATAAVISDAALADDAEITIDIDQVGDGTAKGLKITLIGTRA